MRLGLKRLWYCGVLCFEVLGVLLYVLQSGMWEWLVVVVSGASFHLAIIYEVIYIDVCMYTYSLTYLLIIYTTLIFISSTPLKDTSLTPYNLHSQNPQHDFLPHRPFPNLLESNAYLD